MSTAPAVTMQDLELEHAELLPDRETLCSYGRQPGYSVTNVVGSFDGNTSQQGFLNISVLNGNLNGNTIF
jgi:hypothetical protein